MAFKVKKKLIAHNEQFQNFLQCFPISFCSWNYIIALSILFFFNNISSIYVCNIYYTYLNLKKKKDKKMYYYLYEFITVQREFAENATAVLLNFQF